MLGYGLAAARLAAFLVMLIATTIALQIALAGARGMARSRVGLAFFHFFLRATATLMGVQVRIRGRRPAPGSLIVANHRSYFDILALGAATPCLFLAKAEVGAWPLVGAGVRAVGIPLVARRVPESRRRAAEQVLDRLRCGSSVVNFAEGTTTSSVTPRAFRPGLFHRVVRERLVVVPATIRYQGHETDWVGDATLVDHLFRAVTRLRTRIDLIFSPPLRTEHFANGDRLRLAVYDRVCRPVPEGAGEHEVERVESGYRARAAAATSSGRGRALT
jgi:1-acyl-sn-glycerol-3-phosphate acyltransferase